MILMLFGVLGILVFIRKDRAYLMPNAGVFGQFLIVIPYGFVVGLLSIVPVTSTPVLTLIGMGLFTAISEQIFFFWFLGRALLVKMEDKRLAVALTTLCFGLHELTFFMPPDIAMMDLLSGAMKVMLFVGGACGLALYRGRNIFTPLCLHICIQLVIMLKYGSIL